MIGDVTVILWFSIYIELDIEINTDMREREGRKGVGRKRQRMNFLTLSTERAWQE